MFSLQGISGNFYLVMCLSRNNMPISKTMKVTLIILARLSVLMQAKIYHLDTPSALNQFTENQTLKHSQLFGSVFHRRGGSGHNCSLRGSSFRRIRVDHSGWNNSEKMNIELVCVLQELDFLLWQLAVSS